MNLIGDFNKAGTEKFVTHALNSHSDKTLCGLAMDKLKGDWQWLDDTKSQPSCGRCNVTLHGKYNRTRESF